MSIVASLERIAAAIPVLVANARWYPIEVGHNVVHPPVDAEDLAGMAPGLAELYAACGGLDLGDVENGYFVHPPDLVRRTLSAEGPSSIATRWHDDVVPFGSDGGGTLFVVGRTDGAVYRLPPGWLADGVYRGDGLGHAVVAPSVAAFVARLADDVETWAEDGTTPVLPPDQDGDGGRGGAS